MFLRETKTLRFKETFNKLVVLTKIIIIINQLLQLKLTVLQTYVHQL
jgi:hypothetical protein